MLTKKDKQIIIDALKHVDVKRLELDHPDQSKVKWFRFGSHVGLDIAAEVIKNLPEQKPRKKVDKSISIKVS